MTVLMNKKYKKNYRNKNWNNLKKLGYCRYKIKKCKKEIPNNLELKIDICKENNSRHRR